MDIPKGNFKQDLVYKNTAPRDLMLTFLPPLKQKYEKAPVYFIIPGGGWHSEERQSMIDFSAQSVEALRNEGFAVISIDYRVVGEGAVMRDIVTDCFDAARYAAHFADVFKIDKEKFVLSGHSAGAHLALMLSYAPEKDFFDDYVFDDKFSVNAVAVMSPPTVLYDDRTHNLRNIIAAFKNCDTKEEREKMSPVTYVNSNCPPTLLCAGTCDYLVFASSSDMLFGKLQECGAESKLVMSVGGGHSFEKVISTLEPDRPMSNIQEEITEFVLKHMR